MNLYKDIFNIYSFSSKTDTYYQEYMNMREFILRPMDFHIKNNTKAFNMVIDPEVSLQFNNLQPFFFKPLFEFFLTPLFKALLQGSATELYDPTSDIISDYEFMSLEFSDISPFDYDQIMLQNLPKTPTITYWYTYTPIRIQLSNSLHNQNQHINILHSPLFYKKLFGLHKKVFPFYQPQIFDFLTKNLNDYFPLDTLLLVKRDCQKYFSYSFNKNISWYNIFLLNGQVFGNRSYRYLALIFFDFFKPEYDPYLTYYKAIRKQDFIFPNHKNIILFPIKK